jgi:phage anti-repressor protein
MNELIPFKRLEIIAQSADRYPVDFDEAWQWVGYSRKSDALEMLRAHFIEDTDFIHNERKSKRHNLILRNKAENQVGIHGGKRAGSGRPVEKYGLTTDCFKAFCMMAGTQTGKEVRRYYLDLEKKYHHLLEEIRLSKRMRRELTDIIQDSGLNETMHGFAYKQFTDLINKAVLGMDTRKYRETNELPKDANVREYITPVQRASIAKIERLVGAAIEVGADYYKVKAMIADMGRFESKASGGAA